MGFGPFYVAIAQTYFASKVMHQYGVAGAAFLLLGLELFSNVAMQASEWCSTGETYHDELPVHLGRIAIRRQWHAGQAPLRIGLALKLPQIAAPTAVRRQWCWEYLHSLADDDID